ncbi:hypothetical protein SAMN06296429_103215 [Janibacter indicus]|uniref:Uncharacterized protein n=1 Tax=Janibacter indicus TaxID=857417 RepID=A0A1W1Z990_9MICO|nr:hypothetical protein SAMN06296429_103215 [Janibacter indicus]
MRLVTDLHRPDRGRRTDSPEHLLRSPDPSAVGPFDRRCHGRRAEHSDLRGQRRCLRGQKGLERPASAGATRSHAAPSNDACELWAWPAPYAARSRSPTIAARDGQPDTRPTCSSPPSPRQPRSGGDLPTTPPHPSSASTRPSCPPTPRGYPRRCPTGHRRMGRPVQPHPAPSLVRLPTPSRVRDPATPHPHDLAENPRRRTQPPLKPGAGSLRGPSRPTGRPTNSDLNPPSLLQTVARPPVRACHAREAGPSPSPPMLIARRRRWL